MLTWKRCPSSALQRCAQLAAWKNTQLPMSWISPVSSAMPMNSAGRASSPPGRRQRKSASALATWPVAVSTIGWKYSSNWSSASARRSS